MSETPNETLLIDARYNGPVGRGNGGYIAGAMAAFVSGDAEVRIMRGFPVATALTIRRHPDGSVSCHLDDQELGRARPLELELEIPPPPTLSAARAAVERFRFLHGSDVRGCYVCSPRRAPGEGLRLFCGPLPEAAGDTIVAGVWEPGLELLDASGQVAREQVWAALDCPGGYGIAALAPDIGVQLLGTCAASLKQPLRAGASYIVSSWQLAPPQGRKRFMGVAIHGVTGELMACARQTWIDAGARAPVAE
ncbi:MAG: hypothetical protein AB7S51_08380 [Porticoccaceae bacterium]